MNRAQTVKTFRQTQHQMRDPLIGVAASKIEQELILRPLVRGADLADDIQCLIGRNDLLSHVGTFHAAKQRLCQRSQRQSRCLIEQYAGRKEIPTYQE